MVKINKFLEKDPDDCLKENDPWKFFSFPSFEYYEEEHVRKHHKKFELFRKRISETGARKILDVGCCTGIFYSDLPEREKYEIHGVDVVPEFIELAKKRGILGKICDIDKEPLPYSDNEFDLVIFDSLLEHSLKPIPILNESVRVLRPGGYFFLATPNALSMRSRWNCLRGRNQFSPLINELSEKRNHLRKCSVFYSVKEILRVLPKSLSVEDVIFKNQRLPGKISYIFKFLYLMTIFCEGLRDTIVVIAKKGFS